VRKLNIDVITGTQDIGASTRTLIAQVTVEELGIAIDRIEVRLGDAATGSLAPVSQGSFTVPTVAPAARTAARNLRSQVLHSAALLLNTGADRLVLEKGRISIIDSDEPGIDIAAVTAALGPHTL